MKTPEEVAREIGEGRPSVDPDCPAFHTCSPGRQHPCPRCEERWAADIIRTRDTEMTVAALRQVADEFASGERVMERCTRGLVAVWLRDRAHLIESGERS